METLEEYGSITLGVIGAIVIFVVLAFIFSDALNQFVVNFIKSITCSG